MKNKKLKYVAVNCNYNYNIFGGEYKMIKKKYKRYIFSVLVALMFLQTIITVDAEDTSSFDFGSDSLEPSISYEAEKENTLGKEIFPYGNFADSVEPFDMQFSFSFSEPEITEDIVDDIIYHQITMDDLTIDGDVGEPILPIKPVNILLPQKYRLLSIDIPCGDEIYLGDGFNIKLRQTAILSDLSMEKGSNELCFDPTMSFPADTFIEVGTFYLRGYAILTLNLFPVHYIMETGILNYYEEMTVTVSIKHNGNINPYFRGIPEDEIMITSQEDLINDYNQLSTYVDLPNNPTPRSSIVNPSESYDYVIITTDDLKNANGYFTFQDLINNKNVKGLSAKIVTVEEIEACSAYRWNGLYGDGYQFFDDTQCHIRNFIKDAYRNWETKYILLGGDHPIIPCRSLYCVIYDPLPTWDHIPADLYYSGLDLNFNRNRDDKWGELRDLPDISAEVFLGRACVDNDGEVSNFVEKTLAYQETEPYDSYIETVWMAGEHLWSTPETYGGDYMDEMIDGSSANGYITEGIPSNEYNIGTLYDRDCTAHNWHKSEVINRINNDVHIINHLGHSNYNYNMKMYIADVDALTNNKFCFVYSQGCMAGGFDNPEGYDCIAEHFTVKTDHGAFAGIWNSRYGLGDPGGTDGSSQKFARWFFHSIYEESNDNLIFQKIGPAHQFSREINKFSICRGLIRWCYYTLNLFGDPEITIKIPEDYDPRWISPTGYSDPEYSWHDEIYSFDGNTETKAGCTITRIGWRWTPWLELTLPQAIGCNKIRFYAWYDEDHCDEVDVDIYFNGNWHHVFQGSYTGYQWVQKTFNEQSVTKARISFHVKRWILSPVTADLHEFQFYQVS